MEEEGDREGGKEGARERKRRDFFLFFSNWTWNRDETKRWSDKICGDPFFLISTNRRQMRVSNSYINQTMSIFAIPTNSF